MTTQTSQVRLKGVPLPPRKHLVIALRSIYGIGPTRSKRICAEAAIAEDKKVETLSSDELKMLQDLLDQFLLEGDLRRAKFSTEKELRDKKCYRGLRAQRGLPRRGQRTRTNARTCKGRKKKPGAKKDGKK